ncbi:MAG: hypothetical protein FWD17_02075 [Polyangiaceae bacterium]|nr:hypothetical protein [Polyangiaceae bacterium]
MKWFSDARVLRLVQDERFTKAVMAAMSVPGRAQSFAREQAENVAKAMALATQTEVKDLRRIVRQLEDELRELKAAESGANKKSAAE